MFVLLSLKPVNRSGSAAVGQQNLLVAYCFQSKAEGYFLGASEMCRDASGGKTLIDLNGHDSH